MPEPRKALWSQHAKRPPAKCQRALAFSRYGSAFGQVVEQAGLERLQRLLRFAEEVDLRLARALPLQRVAVERVVRNFLLPGFQQLGGQLVGVDAGERVIHEVLQVVGISALSRGAQQDHGFRDEAPAMRCASVSLVCRNGPRPKRPCARAR